VSLDEFETNEHGHIVLTITGLDLTGTQEIRRLKDAGFRVSKSMELCLTSEKYGGYDKHRLVAHEELVMACCFNPPVTGREVHREDGSYAAPDDS
jgi:hypothetical protein